MKTFFRILLWLILLSLAGVAGYFLLSPEGEEREILSFIPEDFIFALESDKPIEDWRELSNSKVWQYLKGIEYFSEVSNSADTVDIILQNNKMLIDLVKLGDLIISGHLVSPNEYDFTILVDLRVRSLNKVKQGLEIIFRNLDFQVSKDKYFNFDIFELYDPEEKETTYMAIVDNILIASFRKDLVKKAISQTEEPSLGENEDFMVVRDLTGLDGTYSLYLNYELFSDFLMMYAEELPSFMQGLDEVVSFSSFNLALRDDEIVMRGFVKQIDSVSSFLNIFQDVGRGRMGAQNILPSNTALYTSLGFEDFLDFYQRFETYYKEHDTEAYEKFMKSKTNTEKLLKINFQEDFFSWMSEEVVTAIIPVDSLETEYAYYALLHFDENQYDKAQERLKYVISRVKKLPFLRFDKIDYKGFEIRYLNSDAFFKLFFKKLFSKIEKPHYTFLDDYVVFSNDTSSLQFLIDKYLEQDILRNDENYLTFMGKFDRRANVFTYIQNESFYPFLLNSLEEESRQDLGKNKEYLMSFPQVAFQMSPGRGLYEAKLIGEFRESVPDSLQKKIE